MPDTAAPQVAVIGSGWSGATAARILKDAGYGVHILEQGMTVGGHARSERLNGVVYEPNGAHIFHTSDPEVARLVRGFGMARSFEHRVFTEVFLSDHDDRPLVLSWPPQVAELSTLPIWPQVERELSRLPAVPQTDNLESYCLSIMGRTLYEIFIREYTEKQWGCDPATLSSRFAPGRLELRRDGYRRLFRDTWEYYLPGGFQDVIERMISDIPLTAGRHVTIDDLEELAGSHHAVVVTACLDDFARRPGALEWRGVRTESEYIPVSDPAATVTPAYVVNRPSKRRLYTRTIESKHATGQRVTGTVVSREYPLAPARHYPVPTRAGAYERANEELKALILEQAEIPVFFCGRLANYTYINQDQAIAQGISCARQVAARLEQA
jgi:UDP-galactopyranose mutase